MRVKVVCPNSACGKSYSVAEKHVGRQWTCRECGREFIFVPSGARVSPAPAGDGESELNNVQSELNIVAAELHNVESELNSSATSEDGLSGPSPSRPKMPERIGRFEVVEWLGAGGFGAVYRAYDPQLQRDVAVKLLRVVGDEKHDRPRIERFLIEGRAAARLQHPQIVPVFDAGRDEHTGQYYLAAAFIDGQTLGSALGKHPMDVRRAARIVGKLAQALGYADALGILHRDVKPDNIMLDAQDEPHLMDFGLARIEESEGKLTRDGALMGTLEYMSPEQARGLHSKLTSASDQYSLGVVLYELLTGRTPLDGVVGNRVNLLFHHLETEPEPPSRLNPHVSQDLETICLKALAKEPDQRYATCPDLAEDLLRWLHDEPIEARPITQTERLLRWYRRNPVLAGLTALVAALLLLVTVVSTFAAVRLDQERRRADLSAAEALEQKQLAEAKVEEARLARESEILAQTDALLRADLGQVAYLIERLQPHRPQVDPRFRQLAQDASLPPDERLRVALALVSTDRQFVDELVERLLAAEAGEFSLIRAALQPYADGLKPELWQAALDAQTDAQRRFRAGCALALYDPADERWPQLAPFLADHLVQENVLFVSQWIEALRPQRAVLQTPLAQLCRDSRRDASQRRIASTILADYAADNPALLADLLAEADTEQYAILLDVLRRRPADAVRQLRTVLQTGGEDDSEQYARRQAQAAAALLRLGAADDVWPMLKHSPQPEARSWWIHRAAPLDVDPAAIVARLDAEPDVTVRRALLLALGSFNETQVPPGERRSLRTRLLSIYANDPDPGLHGAAEWLLRHWDCQPEIQAVVDRLRGDEAQLQARRDSDRRSWYVNSQGQTFVIIDAGEFSMGSPASEAQRRSDERQHRRAIGRRFAIAAHEVTRAQFARFQEAHPDIGRFNVDDYVKTDDSPQTAVDWYDAAAYCNWLSEQEGIPPNQWCYQPNAQGKYAQGMKARDNYLELSGYRLPSEAEWEYACRAGAAASRYYGTSPSLLPEYAWFLHNSEDRTWPVGTRKPNDFGLFDMLGNAIEWCHDGYRDYPQSAGAVADSPDILELTDTNVRVLRGGSFNDLPSFARCAYRYRSRATNRGSAGGFRAARTYR